MKFKAKLINTAYEMSTILSFAFSLDFIIIYRNMTLINKLILILWLSITGSGVLKILICRLILNDSREVVFEKAFLEIKNAFIGYEHAVMVYILIGMIILSIRVAIPFMIAL